jgi:hypothetical protein
MTIDELCASTGLLYAVCFAAIILLTILLKILFVQFFI